MQYAATELYNCLTRSLQIHCRLGIVNLEPEGSMLWNIAILACSWALAAASFCDNRSCLTACCLLRQSSFLASLSKQNALWEWRCGCVSGVGWEGGGEDKLKAWTQQRQQPGVAGCILHLHASVQCRLHMSTYMMASCGLASSDCCLTCVGLIAHS